MNEDRPFVVEIREGDSAHDIIHQLRQEGLTRKPLYFKILIKLMGIEHKLQAGYYEFESAVTPIQFLKLVLSGEVEVFKITIPEGGNWLELVD